MPPYHATTLACLAAISLAGCQEAAKPAAKAPPRPEVGVVTLRPERVPLATELPGRTAAYLVAEVRPQVGGIVLERPFREGGEVAKGALLYQVDPAPYRAALASAEASLAKARASADSARAKAGRYRQLVSIKAVSAQDLDDAEANLRLVEAEIAASAAAVETARINLEYTRVSAPIQGRVGKSAVTAGALVTANQATALATVQQLDPMYVDVTQTSAETLRLKRRLAQGRLRADADGRARVRLLMEDGTPYAQEGTLEFSDVAVNPGTGSITLRAVFPNPDLDLLPGMYVRAVVETGVDEAGLLAPQRGVSRDPRGNATALFVGRDGKVESRVLKVAGAVGDKWLVEEGAAPGDRIVVEGSQRARPGMVANATEAAPPVAVAGQPQASAVAVKAR